MKLSKAQRQVLERLASGDTLHLMRGMNTSCFWHRVPRGVVYTITALNLEKSALIEDFEKPEWRWRGSRYRITDSGRAALAAR